MHAPIETVSQIATRLECATWEAERRHELLMRLYAAYVKLEQLKGETDDRKRTHN